MHRLFLIFSFILFSLGLHAQITDPAIVELRQSISKIVDTQTLESEERLEWESRKAEMAALLDLHQRELKLLDEELSAAGQSAPGHAETTETLASEIETLKAARRLASEAVARNAPRALALAKSFPPPLLKDAEPEIASLQASKPSDEPREALQAILSMLAKAHQFNRRFTRHFEVREGREVEVLYLGLARAYYAGSGDSAGTGQPGPDGWTWQPRPKLRRELLTAFDILDKKRPPAMVTLPFQIQ